MDYKQKEAIKILNRIKSMPEAEKIMSEDEYFTLLEFIIEKKSEVQFVPQTIPWITPETPSPFGPLGPYYNLGTLSPLNQSRYTSELKKE